MAGSSNVRGPGQQPGFSQAPSTRAPSSQTSAPVHVEQSLVDAAKQRPQGPQYFGYHTDASIMARMAQQGIAPNAVNLRIAQQMLRYGLPLSPATLSNIRQMWQAMGAMSLVDLEALIALFSMGMPVDSANLGAMLQLLSGGPMSHLFARLTLALKQFPGGPAGQANREAEQLKTTLQAPEGFNGVLETDQTLEVSLVGVDSSAQYTVEVKKGETSLKEGTDFVVESGKIRVLRPEAQGTYRFQVTGSWEGVSAASDVLELQVKELTAPPIKIPSKIEVVTAWVVEGVVRLYWRANQDANQGYKIIAQKAGDPNRNIEKVVGAKRDQADLPELEEGAAYTFQVIGLYLGEDGEVHEGEVPGEGDSLVNISGQISRVKVSPHPEVNLVILDWASDPIAANYEIFVDSAVTPIVTNINTHRLMLDPGEHTVTIRAVNAQGRAGKSSDPFSFTVRPPLQLSSHQGWLDALAAYINGVLRVRNQHQGEFNTEYQKVIQSYNAINVVPSGVANHLIDALGDANSQYANALRNSDPTSADQVEEVFHQFLVALGWEEPAKVSQAPVDDIPAPEVPVVVTPPVAIPQPVQGIRVDQKPQGQSVQISWIMDATVARYEITIDGSGPINVEGKSFYEADASFSPGTHFVGITPVNANGDRGTETVRVFTVTPARVPATTAQLTALQTYINGLVTQTQSYWDRLALGQGKVTWNEMKAGSYHGYSRLQENFNNLQINWANIGIADLTKEIGDLRGFHSDYLAKLRVEGEADLANALSDSFQRLEKALGL